MDNKISGLPPQAATAPTTTATSKRGGKSGPSNEAAPVATDNLALTDSARAMQEAASAQSAAGPSFDAAKVERIRTAIANGSYAINAGRIADKLVAMEQQMGNTGKA